MNGWLRPAYLRDPPAWFYPRILVGAGEMLTVALMKKENITHVINCAYNEDSPEWFKNLYPDKYICLNAPDNLTANILIWYEDFEVYLQRFLREPGSGTIFVHCQCGINRSAFLTLAYVCHHFGLDFDHAFSSFQRQRRCMFTNKAYKNQVELFIKNGCVPSQKGERNC